MPYSLKGYEIAVWQLNTELALIRFSFRALENSNTSKKQFLDERSKAIRAGWQAVRKAELGPFAETVAPVFAQKEIDWLQTNLHGVIDQGEQKMNKMELMLRYAFFEAALNDVIGNILWENPILISEGIHLDFEHVPKSKKSDESAEEFRVRRTEKLVDRIDHLPFRPDVQKHTGKSANSGEPRCFCEYLTKGLSLEFEQDRYSETLEKIRKLRNQIAHRAIAPADKLDEPFMRKARLTMTEFPRKLIQAAIELYPNACQIEPSEDGFERPGYITVKILRDL